MATRAHELLIHTFHPFCLTFDCTLAHDFNDSLSRLYTAALNFVDIQFNFKLSLPDVSGTIFNYKVCVHSGKWTHWDTMVEDYSPPEITPQVYSSLLIPNVSSIRTDFLIDVVMKSSGGGGEGGISGGNQRAVLLMGEQGSGTY